MHQKLKHSIVLLALLVQISCGGANAYYPVSVANNKATSAHQLRAQVCSEKIERLEEEIASLTEISDRAEARFVAETAICDSAVLAERYELIRPALLHNVLVKLGLKDRGLCYHWTEDLLKRLKALNLKSFTLHWGVAYRGSNFREHNCVVITAKGQDFCKGIVLDPWRNSGDLYWVQVTKDGYPWEQLPPSDW